VVTPQIPCGIYFSWGIPRFGAHPGNSSPWGPPLVGANPGKGRFQNWNWGGLLPRGINLPPRFLGESRVGLKIALGALLDLFVSNRRAGPTFSFPRKTRLIPPETGGIPKGWAKGRPWLVQFGREPGWAWRFPGLTGLGLLLLVRPPLVPLAAHLAFGRIGNSLGDCEPGRYYNGIPGGAVSSLSHSVCVCVCARRWIRKKAKSAEVSPKKNTWRPFVDV